LEFAGIVEVPESRGQSADGHDKVLRDQADLVLSFGALTWPHQLVRVMLGEQLYRIATILAGHPYHRA
ncbi:MAG: 23S rRNA (pseudouridine(1915)-N(3))-methyltransferase RlmH, partial [Mesorhizobium sp.]